ncbi:bifunctional proline dehydrogenase/L-glutamate gamma-semialdehyde dehydrogenase PutA [Devosia rhodophyticola]|uniref:Bifunctional protein PutA n=1 Tax=Devosia rhodophyticola TaxID=3026423 RepID=A0ABY7YZI5_9HYPH|nr:bifunctional proline dehydrogenase/L-glutamate gamma-semialdehyde dehydrogenase PutA [Devosia rhodophyticola]WDR06803.1 bifunctional proline dehydrogenase/L-glutamate gamma-semialdehyde dehydrogenase PutA [Devosia rhodophyticola]
MSDRLSLARATMRSHTIVDRDEAIARLLVLADLSETTREEISAAAAQLVRQVRGSSSPALMETMLAEYSLSTDEGIALMCLAEALLRVPDADTMDELIADKIVDHDWGSHVDHSGPLLLNASAWALMLTGRVLSDGQMQIGRTLQSMVRRLGEPAIRGAVSAAMRRMGSQFVLGQTIKEALKNGAENTAAGYLYSFDMLGEAARTDADALRYHRAYADAIVALGKVAKQDDVLANHGISVKLSALHPRYEYSQRPHMLPVLCDRLLALCIAAKSARIALNIDAEEADRLDLSLEVIETVLSNPELAGWHGFGVVVQAYGGRAPDVIDWLDVLTEKLDRRISVRLVKGAYWDTEIKRAQVLGLPGFPVFTAKAETDLSYMACARKLLGIGPRIFPQFATHNAHTMAAILAMAPDRSSFEFQRLHGMGETLHEIVHDGEQTRCRIYAPVGAHEDLLAYLVRRLLENGANSSFVNQIVDEAIAPEAIVQDPIARIMRPSRRPPLALPKDIFGSRQNSRGYDLADLLILDEIEVARAPFAAPHQWTFGAGDQTIINPSDFSDTVGRVGFGEVSHIDPCVSRALGFQKTWESRSSYERAGILNAIAESYEANAPEFYALCAREAGKSLADAVGEVREAVDFLRYYAAEAMAEPPRPARGVIVCISPWNFPLAIFTGQIAAALVTGNAVIAKPAEQTNLIASRAVQLMHEAGIPIDVLQLLLGAGETVGAGLVADARINGVCFTGSTGVAKSIAVQLAKTAAPDTLLIAETGGLNAMLVDSTALPEQAVRDIVASAFQSAGQRCSALRLLYVQEDVADKVMEMLKGAMETLSVGNSWALQTDVGPVIDAEARDGITNYCDTQAKTGRVVARLHAPQNGNYVSPTIVRVDGIDDLEREIFGPVLHVATFKAENIDAIIDDINARGYGLTFALHTRIDDRVQQVVDRLHVGNFYVNRNQIGAVVGSQPFGGEGLSGTGPKAGGPLYLPRFGHASKLAQGDHEVTPSGTISQIEVPDATVWSARSDRISRLRALLRGKGERAMAVSAAMDMGPIDLPGPTGEANSLRLVGRGTVLCLGPHPDALRAQVVMALAVGNGVVAVGPTASDVLRGLKAADVPLSIVDGVIDMTPLRIAPISAVAIEGNDTMVESIRQALADREGAIIPVIAGLDPAAYVHERALTVDTTAAGGNASLLASMDGAA